MTTELTIKTMNPVEAYRDVREEVEQLVEESGSLIFDIETREGERDARSHIHSLRSVKGSIERRRKELKADALAFGRSVDAAAKELTARVEHAIGVHQLPLDERAEKEAARIASIEAAVQSIHQAGAIREDATASHQTEKQIEGLRGVSLDPDVFQERLAEATKLRDEYATALDARLALQRKAEAEAAELERLRAERVERERKEREAAIAREAEERAKRLAEEDARKREEEAKRAAAEREAKLVAAREAAEARAKAAEEKAERDKREAAEKAKRDREAAEAKAKADADRVKLEEKHRLANKRHVAKVKAEASNGIVKILEQHESAEAATGALVEAIASGKIPHTSMKF